MMPAYIAHITPRDGVVRRLLAERMVNHMAAELALQFDPYTRALWHLELLGCYAPDDAIAPYLPPPARTPHDDDDDCDDWGDLACTHCGGEGFCEVDDPLWDKCDEYGWGPCNACRGTGRRKHQWVF